MTESPKLNVCRPPRTRNCCWPKWAFFLNVSGNSLSGSISDLSSLRSCSSLKSLNLSRNGFIFSGSSGGFPMPLQSVDFSYNKIASQNALPWILSDCSELRVLDLKGNKISSTIPVFDCARLEHIDLPANNFSGPISGNTHFHGSNIPAPTSSSALCPIFPNSGSNPPLHRIAQTYDATSPSSSPTRKSGQHRSCLQPALFSSQGKPASLHYSRPPSTKPAATPSSPPISNLY